MPRPKAEAKLPEYPEKRFYCTEMEPEHDTVTQAKMEAQELLKHGSSQVFLYQLVGVITKVSTGLLQEEDNGPVR